MRDWETTGYWMPLALVPMGGSLGASELKGDRMALLCGRRAGVQWSADSKRQTADNAGARQKQGDQLGGAGCHPGKSAWC